MDWLCQRQERWPELADVLARRVAIAAGGGALELRFRLAQIRESKLLDKYGALDLYTQILAEAAGPRGRARRGRGGASRASR